MSTAPISLHNIVELSLALLLHNYDHTATLVCQQSTYAHRTQRRIITTRHDFRWNITRAEHLIPILAMKTDWRILFTTGHHVK